MCIYKYISNLQTQFKGDILYIYRIAVSCREFSFKIYPIPRFQTNPQTKHSEHTVKAKWVSTHPPTRTHTHTLTHTVSPVGILLYVVIRGGCTIKQARVQ